MSTVASRKQKGRSLQNFVRDLMRSLSIMSLQPGDIESRPMGSQGTDIILSPAALERWPLSIECKNQERVNLWASWEQANDNQIEGTIPVLVIKKNREKPVVVVDAETFFHMVAEVNTQTSTDVV